MSPNSLSKKILLILCCLYFFAAVVIPNQVKLFNKASIADLILLTIIGYYFFAYIFLKNLGFKKLLGKIYSFFKRPMILSMVVLFAVMLVSTLYSTNKIIAVTESIRFLLYLIIGFIIISEFSNEKYISTFIYTFSVSSIAVNIIALYQFITKTGIKVNVELNGSTGRIESTFGNPNAFGAFLVISLFPCIMLFLLNKNKKIKFAYLTLSIVSFINLILTLSRNSWLAFALGMLILIFTYNWRFIYLMIVGGIASMFIPIVNTRIKQFADFSQNEGRIKIWSIASKMIKDHPLRGVGNGNFSELYDSYVEKYPEYWQEFVSQFPTHNSYLKIQSELGIGGTISFLFTIVFIFKNLLASCKKYSSFANSFYKGFLISAVCMVILNLFDNIFFVPQVATVFWIFAFFSDNGCTIDN
jgi:O-antigen ligase